MDKQKESFWYGTHPLLPELKRIADALIPLSGPTQSWEAEVLRATQRLLYEWGNNGGGNNKCNEVEFLLAHGATHGGVTELQLRWLRDNHNYFNSDSLWDEIDASKLESLVESSLNHILKLEQSGVPLTPGNTDLLDKRYSAPDVWRCQGCSSFFGHDVWSNYFYCEPCWSIEDKRQREEEECSNDD